MPTTLFDLCESQNGGFAIQTTAGSTVVPDSTVLIPGLQTMKSTVTDSFTSVDRADLLIDNFSHVCPPGSLGIGPGSSSYWRIAMKLLPGFTPGGGAQPRFNVKLDIHGNLTFYTPWALEINQATGKWCVEIDGGGANPSTPTSAVFHDLFPWVVNDVVDWKFFVTLKPDDTAVTIIRASINGAADVEFGPYTDPIGCSTETGFYMKPALYRRGNIATPTSSVLHSGMIRGDSWDQLAVPAAGTNKVGYLSGGVPVVGGTVNANGVGRRGSGPFTMPEDGTLTHLAGYFDFTGTGQIQSLLAAYADNGATPPQPGVKLGQTRIVGYEASTAGSGFKEVQLCKSVSLLAGQKFWIIQEFEVNAALVRSRLDAVGSNTFFSQTSGWSAPGGPPDPIGANTTVNPNRTMSVYALYAVPRADTASPSSSCTGPTTTQFPALTLPWTATDDIGLASVALYVRNPNSGVYVLAQSSGTSGTNPSGAFAYQLAAGYGSYGFYTLATDAAGNTEPTPDNPDLIVAYAPGLLRPRTLRHRRHHR